MRKGKQIASIALSALLGGCLFTGCGEESDPLAVGKTTVEYWGSAAMETAVAIQNAVKWYNENNTDNIYVKYVNKPAASYGELLSRTLTAGVKGPDIFNVSDASVKTYSSFTGGGVLENLQSYIEADPEVLNGIEPAALSCYRYGNKKMTVNESDPLYALPKTVNTAVLAYNATAMKNQGIIIVSVDEENIEAFNNGAPDNYGNTKEDYGIDWDIRARGFDRWDGMTDRNYIKGSYSSDGKTFTANSEAWTLPEYGEDGKLAEKMVFNNRIAMSWDEVEDVGRIMTGLYKNRGPNYYPQGAKYRPSTDWGFYTRYWFAYGWNVGGGACKDTTGNGDWEFSLGETDRYCLLYEKTGETANFDIDEPAVDGNGRPIFVKENEVGSYQKTANQYFSDPLPSQYQAFERFFYQQKPKEYGGLYIGPRQTSDIGGSTELAFFTTGRMCMFGHFETSMILSARKAIGDSFEWDVAPTPTYKTYDAQGKVSNKGSEMFYSYTNAGVAMWNNSPRKQEAFKVLKYLSTGKFQEMLCNEGYNLSSVAKYNYDNFVKVNTGEGLQPKNVKLFADTVNMRFEDENIYFPDSYWVTYWSEPLNSTYRENNRSFDEFLTAYASGTNAELKKCKQELGL